MSLVNDVDLRADGWVVVVPAKGGDKAKSRLTAPRGTQRHTLAAAFALDTVAAALAAVGTGRVYAVTGPGPLVALLEALGAVVVPDPGGGLNAAIRAGLAHAAAEAPVRVGLAVLLADLPALTADSLSVALGAAAGVERAVVPDVDGTGSVLITATGGAVPEPAFGLDSAARHAAGGQQRLDLDLPRLRTDVDDTTSLRAALSLGVGRHTTAALHHAATG